MTTPEERTRAVLKTREFLITLANSARTSDVPEIVRIFLTINIYLMPIMYLPEMVPGPLRLLLAINPFSSLIWCYQDVLYYGHIEHPLAWLGLAAVSGCALAAGSYVFVRLRHHFSSVL